MAIVYVWSGATGLADGTSWADAYTTLQAGLDNTTPSTDQMYVHMGATTPHSETAGGNTTFTSTQADSDTALIQVFGVDKDNSDASVNKPSAITFETTAFDITFSLNAVFHGLHFKADDDMNFNVDSITLEFVGGVLETGAGAGNDMLIGATKNNVTFRDCTIICDQINNFMGLEVFSDCTIDIKSSTCINVNGSASLHAIFEACDFSALTAGDTLVGLNTELKRIDFINCDMPTTWTATTGTWGEWEGFVRFFNCDDSSDYPRTEIYSRAGDAKTDTGVYITSSGWSDETANSTGTPLSQRLTPSSVVNLGGVLSSAPIDEYIDSTGSKTFTVELIDDFETPLQDDKVWLEIFYHATSGQVKQSVGTSRVILGDTVANLAAGTGVANWTGEPTSSRSVKLEVPATVNNIGDYSAVVRLAKYEANGADTNPGAALYVAPILTIS